MQINVDNLKIHLGWIFWTHKTFSYFKSKLKTETAANKREKQNETAYCCLICCALQQIKFQIIILSEIEMQLLKIVASALYSKQSYAPLFPAL